MIRSASALTCAVLFACGGTSPAPVVTTPPVASAVAAPTTSAPVASDEHDAGATADAAAPRAPKPTTVATIGGDQPYVSVDDAGIFFMRDTSLCVYGLDGSGPRTIATSFHARLGMVVGPAFIVGVGDPPGGPEHANGVSVLEIIAKSGGPSKTIASIHGLALAPVVMDDSFVYFSTYDGKLSKVALGGGAPVVLYARKQRVKDMPYDDFRIALDANDVYFAVQKTSAEGASIKAVPKGGGAPRTVVDGAAAVRLKVDATHVYWMDLDSTTAQSKLFRAPKAGGGGGEIVADGVGTAWLVDAGSVFYVTAGKSSGNQSTSSILYAKALVGGAPEELVSEPVFGLARVRGALYWSGNLGVIRRLAN